MEKKVLIITKYNASPHEKITHYSGAKGYLLAYGLKKNGFNIDILSNITVSSDMYNYVNYKDLSIISLSKYKYIFFILFNKEILKTLHEKVDIFKKLQKAKEICNDLKIIFKGCNFPNYLDEHNIVNTALFFNKIFVQTEDQPLPKILCKNLDINDNLSVKNYIKHCKNKNKECIVSYCENTFIDKNLIKYDNKKNYDVDNKLINIVYMGRLMCNNNGGLEIIYLKKLMKILGLKYCLYILPGSFYLPTDFPVIKKSPKRPHQFLELKENLESQDLIYDYRHIKTWMHKENYDKQKIEKTKSNIKVLNPIEYGEHINFLKLMDIAIGFSRNKLKRVEEQSAKLWDYMFADLHIIMEDGWNNTPYITKYNFGDLLPLNSKVSCMVEKIKKFKKNNKRKSKYNDFIIENDYIARCKKILKEIEK